MDSSVNENRIWEYLDGNMSSAESENFRIELRDNEELMMAYEHFKKVHLGLSEVKVQSAPTGFTQRVMGAITAQRESYRKGGLLLSLLALFTVLGGSLFIFDSMLEYNIHVNGIENIIDQTQLVLNIDFQVVNIVLMTITSILGLLVLDKALLKPYFQNRRYHHE